MKQIAYILLIFSLFSCSGGNKKTEQNTKTGNQQNGTVEINSEAKELLKYLTENGDYVNSREFPSMISPESVFSVLSENTLVIDMRKSEIYVTGHINGAVNVLITDLPDYFSTKIKPFEYDKIVLACYSGQSSSYVILFFRFMGYGNVYSMRWGMSGWNNKMDNKWMANISSKYEDKLEITDNPKAAPGDFPKIGSGKSTGAEIMDERVKALFKDYENAGITADSVFAHPEEYYIINYERKDKYDAGHIPGAVRYKPNGTLGIIAEMQSIPSDREIVVYCSTGHNSAFVTAYLRLFGYNAKTLRYGNNGFMHDRMIRDEQILSWQPYTINETHDFPVVK